MGHIGKIRNQKLHKSRQLALLRTHWKFRYCHGGTLRQKRRGRQARPLSTRNAVHLVFKADRSMLRRGYRLLKDMRGGSLSELKSKGFKAITSIFW